MSRQRAIRREARLAESARRAAATREEVARRVARQRRRRRRRTAVRSALPWRPGQRWSRRTRAQRVGVWAAALGLLVVTYLVTNSLRLVVALALALAVAAPALVTLVLGRSRR